MKSKSIALVVAGALALAPLAASAIGKNEKGCLVGGAVGGVGGHLVGGHGLLGAAAGCGVGALVANEQKKKDGEAKRREEAEQRRAHAQHRRHENHVAREERREGEGR